MIANVPPTSRSFSRKIYHSGNPFFVMHPESKFIQGKMDGACCDVEGCRGNVPYFYFHLFNIPFCMLVQLVQAHLCQR